MTLSSDAILTIHNELKAVVVSKPSPPPSTNPKGNRARSPSHVKGVGKAKKSKEPSFPLDPISSSNKVPITKDAADVATPLDLEVTTMAGVGEALEGKKEGLVAIEET